MGRGDCGRLGDCVRVGAYSDFRDGGAAITAVLRGAVDVDDGTADWRHEAGADDQPMANVGDRDGTGNYNVGTKRNVADNRNIADNRNVARNVARNIACNIANGMAHLGGRTGGYRRDWMVWPP